LAGAAGWRCGVGAGPAPRPQGFWGGGRPAVPAGRRRASRRGPTWGRPSHWGGGLAVRGPVIFPFEVPMKRFAPRRGRPGRTQSYRPRLDGLEDRLLPCDAAFTLLLRAARSHAPVG